MFGNDLDYWRSRGIQVLIWGGNPVTGVIEIGVRAEDLARAREEIPRYYPNLQIVISPSEGVSWSRRTTPR